MYNITAITAM